MAILVTGASGRIGGSTLRALTQLGEPAIALVRGSDRARSLPAEVEHRFGDLADRASLRRAFSGIERLLLCSGHAPDMRELQLNAIDVAREAGVSRIVKISASPATAFAGTPSAVAAQHLEVERALATSGIESTNIRPNAFAQMLYAQGSALATGRLELALGASAVSWVDAEDVGAVAAAALLTGDGLPVCVEVTGPEALDGNALARILSQVSDLTIVYEAISDDESRARLAAAGLPGWLVEHIVVVFSLLRDDGERVTDQIERWTGRVGTPVSEVLAREPERDRLLSAIPTAAARR
jgi:uncharacterized protein YbjT (DUF2867 family)